MGHEEKKKNNNKTKKSRELLFTEIMFTSQNNSTTAVYIIDKALQSLQRDQWSNSHWHSVPLIAVEQALPVKAEALGGQECCGKAGTNISSFPSPSSVDQSVVSL